MANFLNLDSFDYYGTKIIVSLKNNKASLIEPAYNVKILETTIENDKVKYKEKLNKESQKYDECKKENNILPAVAKKICEKNLPIKNKNENKFFQNRVEKIKTFLHEHKKMAFQVAFSLALSTTVFANTFHLNSADKIYTKFLNEKPENIVEKTVSKYSENPLKENNLNFGLYYKFKNGGEYEFMLDREKAEIVAGDDLIENWGRRLQMNTEKYTDKDGNLNWEINKENFNTINEPKNEYEETLNNSISSLDNLINNETSQKEQIEQIQNSQTQDELSEEEKSMIIDNGIEQIQENQGLSEIAIQKDIEKSKPDYYEDGKPKWYDDKESEESFEEEIPSFLPEEEISENENTKSVENSTKELLEKDKFHDFSRNYAQNYENPDEPNWLKNYDEKNISETKNEEIEIPYAVTYKNPDITKEKYNNDIKNLIQETSKIPENDLNLSKKDKNLLKQAFPFFKNSSSQSLEKQQKNWNKFVLSKKNDFDFWENLGHLYNKTTDKYFLGLKKKHSEITKKERDETEKAIRNNKHPLQVFNNKPMPYIIDALTNNIFRGATQLYLNQKNLLDGTNNLSYVQAPQAIKNNGKFMLSKNKNEPVIIANGLTEMGKHQYTLLLPSKTVALRNTQEEKKEKQLRKLIAKKARLDIKFFEKYGEIPLVSLSLYEQPRQPIPYAENIQTEIINPQNSDLKDIIKNSCETVFQEMFTQENKKLPVDFTKEPYKTKLLEFAKTNPEEFKKIQNEAYVKTAKQVHSKEYTNQMAYENTQQNKNTNKKTQGRKR